MRSGNQARQVVGVGLSSSLRERNFWILFDSLCLLLNQGLQGPEAGRGWGGNARRVGNKRGTLSMWATSTSGAGRVGGRRRCGGRCGCHLSH